MENKGKSKSKDKPGNQDKSGKWLMACKDVFAELINGLIYHGKKVLAEENMLQGPTESIYRGQHGELSSQFQDCSMYEVREGIVCAMYTIENQSSVDSRMPLRCAGYDGAAYRRQYKSQMGQRVYPIVSVVLNWGTKPWEAALSVRELLDYPLPEEIEDYLDKNRIHVFDMRFLEAPIRAGFEGDIRVILDYLCDHESMFKRRQKLKNPEEVMRMLYALSGDVRYLGHMAFMGGDKSMCALLDYMVNQGKQQGIEEGKLLEKQQGIRVLIMTYKEFGVSYEAAAAGVKEKYGLEDAEVQEDMKLYW